MPMSCTFKLAAKSVAPSRNDEAGSDFCEQGDVLGATCGECGSAPVIYHGRGGQEPIAAAGTAQEETPWRAVQRAGWAALPEAA
jgi:hypothetical protein